MRLAVYTNWIYDLLVIQRVEVSRLAVKQLRKAPHHVTTKFMAWVDDMEERGIEEIHRVPGYNDHPLKVQEVHPHDY